MLSSTERVISQPTHYEQIPTYLVIVVLVGSQLAWAAAVLPWWVS